AKKAKRKEEARAKKRRGHGANLEDFLVRTKERLEARAAEAEAEAAALLVAPKRGASGDVHGFVQKTRERLVEQVQAERAALRARQAKAAAAAAGADLDAFRQQCEARLAQRLLAGMPQVKTGLVEAEGGTGFFRRKICIVGAGPVGLWAAMLLAQKYRWTDPSGCARLRPDAPQLVLLEARSAESHCSRTDIRIALSSSTRAMLDQQTRSRSFSSGMPVAEIEEAFLRRWRKLAGSEAKILYDTSVQDLGALEDCDCVFWAAGRRSLEDASRKALGCEVKVGDSQKVIVFQISELGPDTNAWQLASLDLSGIAQQASRSLCNLRVMLRPGFEGACACWLWVFGLPEMEEKGKALVPRATLAEACQDVACQDALLPALEVIVPLRAVCTPELPPVSGQARRDARPCSRGNERGLRAKLGIYRKRLELRAAERAVGDPYLQDLSLRPKPRQLPRRYESPSSGSATRPATRETPCAEEHRASADVLNLERSPWQEVGRALELWNGALRAHFARAANAERWLEAMCGGRRLRSAAQLQNLGRRLGLGSQ
ncbi:unnamed protein product, partial [Effrenium voratum]